MVFIKRTSGSGQFFSSDRTVNENNINYQQRRTDKSKYGTSMKRRFKKK